MKRRSLEDALQHEPFPEPSRVTTEQLYVIQERVLRRDRRPSYVPIRRVLPIALVLVFLAILIGINLPEKSSPAQLVSTPPTDEQILKLMNDTSPGLNPVIMYKEVLDDHQMLIFTSIVRSEESIMTWEAGLLNWAEGGMSWSVQGHLEVPLLSELDYRNLAVEGINEVFNYSFIPFNKEASSMLVFGASLDPDVGAIWMTDPSKSVYNAKMIQKAHGAYTLWFMPLPSTDESSYQLHAADMESAAGPINFEDHEIPLYRRLEMSTFRPEDIHIPLHLAEDPSDENPIGELLHTWATETSQAILIGADYQLKDGKAQFWISQSSGEHPNPEEILNNLKSNFPTETLTEATINGHKALIEQNEIRGQIFIVTEHYFYSVASTYSIDMDILLSAAKQIKLP